MILQNILLPSKIEENTAFSHFAVMLSQPTIFQIAVKLWSGTLFFLLKPPNFSYFLSIAVVWFRPFIFLFSFPINFWHQLFDHGSSKKKLMFLYSESFFSSRRIMDVCKKRSSSYKLSVKYPLRVLIKESLKNTCERVYFWL